MKYPIKDVYLEESVEELKNEKIQPKVRFHHVGIVVRNIREAVDKYAAALGINIKTINVEYMSYMTGKGEVEEFKYAFLPLAEGENNFMEFVEPVTPGPTLRYLEKHGEGLFHLAFESNNITETLNAFEKVGIPQAGSTPTQEVLSVFLHPKCANGVLIQLLKENVFNHSGRLSNEVLDK